MLLLVTCSIMEAQCILVSKRSNNERVTTYANKLEVFSKIDCKSKTNQAEKKQGIHLLVLVFLSLKRNGSSMKGRSCTDSYPHRIWIGTRYSVSLATAVESLFYTVMVDIMEEIDLAMCDLIPGYFLHIDMEGDILLCCIEKPLALLIVVKLGRKYWKNNPILRGRLVIFVRCDASTYRNATSALTLHKKLIEHLSD